MQLEAGKDSQLTGFIIDCCDSLEEKPIRQRLQLMLIHQKRVELQAMQIVTTRTQMRTATALEWNDVKLVLLVCLSSQGPDMLHVVFASDANQAEGGTWCEPVSLSRDDEVCKPASSGVQASVASVVSSTASPDELTIHIIVQGKSLNDFKAGNSTERGWLPHLAIGGMATSLTVSKMLRCGPLCRGWLWRSGTLWNPSRVPSHCQCDWRSDQGALGSLALSL